MILYLLLPALSLSTAPPAALRAAWKPTAGLAASWKGPAFPLCFETTLKLLCTGRTCDLNRETFHCSTKTNRTCGCAWLSVCYRRHLVALLCQCGWSSLTVLLQARLAGEVKLTCCEAAAEGLLPCAPVMFSFRQRPTMMKTFPTD